VKFNSRFALGWLDWSDGAGRSRLFLPNRHFQTTDDLRVSATFALALVNKTRHELLKFGLKNLCGISKTLKVLIEMA
jgi:hypothetical protein